MAKAEVAATSKIEKMKVHGSFKNKVMVSPFYYEQLKQEKAEWAILKTPQGEWEVKVHKDDNGDIFLEDGWPEFTRQNDFNDHDYLEFEYVCNKMHFNVNVAGSTSPQNQGSQAKSCKGKAKKKAVVIPHDQWSFFNKIIRSDFVKKSAMMHIPMDFVKSNNFKTKKNVMLMDPQGKKWAVELQIQHDGRNRLRMYMTKGWSDFVEANELKVKDVCKFILNPESPSACTSLFHVQIKPSKS